MLEYDTIRSDVLVIGGGGAGLRAAIEADNHGAKVVLASKGPITRCGLTNMAGGSYQAAFGHEDPRDNPEVHFRDTVEIGRYLGDENLIRALADEACPRALDLVEYGVQFRMIGDKFAQQIHPGQTYPRICMIKGVVARGMLVGLAKELKRHRSITVLEDVIVTKVLTRNDQVCGAVALNLRSGTFYLLQAKSIILATGGYEELWGKTDSALDSTGDGTAIAYHAGAELVDMEMVLWYPAVLAYPKGVEGIAIQYETLLDEQYMAGKLLNGKGEDFLPPGKLPPRDVMTRLIFDEIQKGDGNEHDAVYIDVTKSPKSKQEIQDVMSTTSQYVTLRKSFGMDILSAPIEISPGVHFTLGGVRINEFGATSLHGLYAVGEVSGNTHGANRISGNALAETQVFGARAGKRAAKLAKEQTQRDPDFNEVIDEITKIWHLNGKKGNGVRPMRIMKELRSLMDAKVGLSRSQQGLSEALLTIKRLRDEAAKISTVRVPNYNNEWLEAVELGFMLDLCELVASTALLRCESRGHHYRVDFPQTDENWLKHTIIMKTDGESVTSTAPIIRLNKLGV